MSEDRCICCGDIVPEGRMVCPNCEKPKKPRKCNHPEEAPACYFHYNGVCSREHNYECPALAMKNLSHGEMVQIAEGKKNKTPRYIDANRLIDMATHEGAYGYVDVHDIYNAPTADVVEVVRCKDCRYECGDACLHALGLAAIESPKCYCAYGSRKEKADAEIH